MTPRALASAVLALLLGACALPPRDTQPSSEDARPAPPRATVRRASGDVHVRLAQFAGASRIEVRDGRGGLVHIVRKGSALEVDSEPREELLLSGRGPWTLSGRTYRGALRVRAMREGSGLEVTNIVDLEDYVAGVVAAELALWSADPETLRCQAIAARSYAVAALDERGARRADPYLQADTRDMAYSGAFQPKSERERELERRLARAVESTRGRVLLEGERVVDARFHAACGGSTANARDVFPEAGFECLRSVPCPACRGELGLPREASVDSWSFTAPRSALDALAARFRVGTRLTGLAPLDQDEAGRWLHVELSGPAGSARVRFEELRRALGPEKLPSARIESTWPRAGEALTGGLRIDGRGRGHGVGLCQRAARDCAKAGWTAERILAHYYPGTRLVDWR